MVGSVSAWKKVPVKVDMDGRTALSGNFVIARDARLSDFLNNPKKTFIVLVDDEQNTHIINKHHIIQVCEIKNAE